MATTSPLRLIQAAHEHHKAGRIGEAAILYVEALKLDPNQPDALYLLGQIYWQEGRLAEAETLLSRAHKARPDTPAFLDGLGTVLTQLGRLNEALPLLRRAVEVDPKSATAHRNLGVLMLFRGEKSEAETSLRHAMTLDPANPDNHDNLATLLHSNDDLDGALAHYEQSLALRPGWGNTLMNLANLKKELGCSREAMRLYAQAAAVMPNDQKVRKGHLSLLTYVPNLDPEDVFDHHTAFAAWVPQAPEPAPVFANSRNANRRLRIGYVSSDFRAHPVTRNMLPLLRHHDRAQVEVCLYHNTRARDSDTERCQALADLWRETPSLRDDQLAALMRQDGIDIAIILAGHFDSNRIALPRFRPAPICMGFHDVATSGFTETDYLISDITLTPRATREMFSERVLHLPSYYLHDPLDDVPTPPQPGRINGAITFGAFNNTSKINDEVLSLWARVINAVPNSRLSLKYRNFYASTAVRERIVRVMAEHDVSSKRLEFQTGWDDRSAHLARIGGVDIALDTFPFSGSTTTFESLWMGVPVVTWPQTPMVSRWSASQLKALGLSDLIAQDAGDFVRIARELALDIPRLEAVRLNLRERLRASPLCDGALRARQIERFYRATWHRWVARG